MSAQVLTDCERSFATLRESFPAVHSDVDWCVPVSCARLRSGDAAAIGDLAAHELQIADPTCFERAGKGFRWAVE